MGAPLLTLILEIVLLWAALVSKLISPFVHKRNRYGDRGSPYLNLLFEIRWPFGVPFIRME